jgi:putative PIN family toxin of toxin-antitoxin system
MRVILDTNVFISALMNPKGTPGLIYAAWLAGTFDLVTSDAQLAELKRVSRYPRIRKLLTPYRVSELIAFLKRGEVLKKLPPTPEIADPDDRFLLAMAIAGNADYLVTGDHRAGLLQLVKLGRTWIVTPAAFKAEVLA